MQADDRKTEAALRLWASHLREATDAQLDAAIARTVTQYPTWPPTLGEFLILADQKKKSIPEYMVGVL